MSKFKQFWKGQVFYFEGRVHMVRNGAFLTRNFHLISNSKEEALKEAQEHMELEFKHYDYSNIEVIQVQP